MRDAPDPLRDAPDPPRDAPDPTPDSSQDATVDAQTDGATEHSVVLRVSGDLDDGELESSRTFGTAGYAPQGERNGWTYMGASVPTGAGDDGVTISFFRFALPEGIGARIVETAWDSLRIRGVYQSPVSDPFFEDEAGRLVALAAAVHHHGQVHRAVAADARRAARRDDHCAGHHRADAR